MARYVGPCAVCGDQVDRIIRPGRALTCVECAIRRQLDYIRSMGEGTNPDLARCQQAGRATAEAIKSRNGPMYEKWRNAIRAAVELD